MKPVWLTYIDTADAEQLSMHTVPYIDFKVLVREGVEDVDATSDNAAVPDGGDVLDYSQMNRSTAL